MLAGNRPSLWSWVVSVLAGTLRAVSIRQRLYPTSGQRDVLVMHCSHTRFVWNLALEQANFYRKWQGSTPNSTADRAGPQAGGCPVPVDPALGRGCGGKQRQGRHGRGREPVHRPDLLPPVFARTAPGVSTGVDRGVKNGIATSQGKMDHAPTLSGGEQARFLALSRRMSRQDKGSNRRNRTRLSLAKLHARLGIRRMNWA